MIVLSRGGRLVSALAEPKQDSNLRQKKNEHLAAKGVLYSGPTSKNAALHTKIKYKYSTGTRLAHTHFYFYMVMIQQMIKDIDIIYSLTN